MRRPSNPSIAGRQAAGKNIRMEIRISNSSEFYQNLLSANPHLPPERAREFAKAIGAAAAREDYELMELLINSAVHYKNETVQ
jgi:hypothetical protein